MIGDWRRSISGLALFFTRFSGHFPEIRALFALPV
jgi:hypothetical protein